MRSYASSKFKDKCIFIKSLRIPRKEKNEESKTRLHSRRQKRKFPYSLQKQNSHISTASINPFRLRSKLWRTDP